MIEVIFLFQGYLCKLILVFLMYGYVAPVFWMFIEGVYLHSRIATNIFDSPAPFTIYYIIGWGKFFKVYLVLTGINTFYITLSYSYAI